jgi:hypothetical protein
MCWNFLVGTAQSNFIPLHSESVYSLSRFEILNGPISDHLHFSVLPLQRSKAIQFIDSAKGSAGDWSAVDRAALNFLLVDNDEWSNDSLAMSRKPFWKVFYRDKASLYQYRSDDFMVKLNPVFRFEAGTESESGENLFTNSRGIEARGWIAKKVGYYFYLTENQARYPVYVRERTDSAGAVPLAGYFKEFKTTGVDFFDAKGYFDFTAAKFITVQFGHDKNFLGPGFRTLALSDFSEDYLFLKLQTQVWKIQYQNLFLDLTADFLRGGDTLLPKKYAAIHHLSINAARWLNLGVWESVVYHRNEGYELQYLNPIIFYRSIEQLLGSPDNVMLGLDYRIQFLRRFAYYGQLMLDDFNFQFSKGEQGYWANKWGIQQGVKYLNAFTIDNLDLMAEWNIVRPYVYSHDDSIANYSNYNAPLAHPLGANFSEWMFMARYQPVFPLVITAKLNFANQGRDSSGTNWGANLFIPTTEANIETVYGNTIGQGIESKLMRWQISASYMLRHNLLVDAHYIFRKTTSPIASFESQSNIFQFGIRMNLWQPDFDF